MHVVSTQTLKKRSSLSQLLVWLGLCCAVAGSATATSAAPAPADPRPNIVLVLFEDMSARVAALGDPVAVTPTLDDLARESVVYENTFTASGVCAPSRAALITGRYAPSIGAQHMRTHGVYGLQGGGPQNYYAVPPSEVRAFPELLRAAGYYTSNNSKTDYQFGEPRSIWDANGKEADWRGRREGQPFFSMFTILTTHESYLWPTDREPASPMQALVQKRNAAELNYRHERIDADRVVVPPYLPDTPIVRADIARHYDNIALADSQLADLLARLRADDLLQNTILVVSTDHGDGLPRAKRSLYDSGLKVPLFVRYPEGQPGGTERTALVSFVDLAPQILRWAGVNTPDWMQGRPFAGADTTPRNYIFATQDRIDTRTYLRRAIRDERYKLIVNFREADPYFEHIPFRDALPTMEELWRGLEDGTLPGAARLLFDPLPEHQLFDTQTDPHEINNLAGQPALAEIERDLRSALNNWIASSDDSSFAMQEDELIESFWPGGQQPSTLAPVVKEHEDGGLLLFSETEGAAIEWRCTGDEAWQLYASPITTDCAAIEAVAQRYGYAESPVVALDLSGERRPDP